METDECFEKEIEKKTRVQK